MTDDCIGVTHERYTTIVPFPLTNMPGNLAVPDPMSQHLAKAAQEAINVDILPEVLETLARTDTSFVKLKRFSIKLAEDVKDPIVKQVAKSRRETRSSAQKPQPKPEQKPAPPKQKQVKDVVPKSRELPAEDSKSPVAALQKLSTGDIQSRTATPPNFRQLGASTLVAGKGPSVRQASERDQRLLVAAYEQTFSTLAAVYQAYQESGRGHEEGQGNIFYDDELTILAKSFAGFSCALQGCPADCIFIPDLQPQTRIPDLIRCCATQARAARGALIMSLQENMNTRSALLLQAGLEAAAALLRLCAAEACPQALLSEAALEKVCALVATVTNQNILAFFDPIVRHEARPDLHGNPLRLSAAEGKGKLSNCGRYICGGIAAVVEGLQLLSWRVSLKNESLTTALSALAGVLHTPALSNMHSSIISLFTRVYDSRKQEGTAACLDVLGVMIKPFISQIQDNSVPKGCHLLNGVYVRPVTLAVLSLVHAEAQLPILGCSESDIKAFFSPVLHLCSEFWGQLLEQICHKPGHEPKLAKVAVEGIAAELADLLPQPEWPGAHVLLHVMCKSLVEALQGGKAPAGGLETTREDREHFLDLAGFLVAKIMPHCEEPGDDAKALFLRLLSLQQGKDGAAGGGGVGEPPPRVPMQLLRQHEVLLHLLLGAWLQCDGRLDAASAAAVRRCSCALELFSNLERVRASETRAVSAHSPLACRPEENLQTCLTAAHSVLTFSAPDTATEALLDMVQLAPAQASALHSLLLHGSLLPQMLDYLLSRITRSAVPATEPSMKVRASAWRAIAQVLAVAPHILQVSAAQAALSSALSDKEKSATVQDKALDILSHHMQGNVAVCMSHLPMIKTATKHTATSVRKRAVDILWECYINAPSIAEHKPALVTHLLLLQLQMFDDQEPSMRTKLLDAFRGRWFSARTKEEARAPAAELCLILRALSADRNVLPMPHDFVLRRLLHTILHGDPDLAAPRKAAAACCEHARQAAVLMADVMLGAVLDGTDERGAGDSAEAAGREAGSEFEGASLVILAFATVDIGLVMPSADDPAHAAAGRRSGGSNAFKFFEPLRLQLRGAPEAVQAAVARDRASSGRDATAPYVEARIRAVVLATSLLLNEARKKELKPAEGSLAEMVEDLEQLLRAQVSVAALQNTCQALAAVALVSPTMSRSIENFCESIYAQLVDLLSTLTAGGTAPNAKAERVFKKYLHILCALLRYLAPHPRAMALSGPAFDFAAARALPDRASICRSVFAIATNVAKLPLGVQDAVLTGLMQLLIGFPAECNDFSGQVLTVLQRYLSADSRPQVIWRVLSSLIELVRSEELECMQAAERHKEAADADSKSKVKVELAKVNGLNEGISNAGAIIQSLWGSARPTSTPAGGIAFAMLFAGPPAARITTRDQADALQQVPLVRLEGVALLDLVQRSGAVAPWLYLPPAFALSLDGTSSVSERALRILQRCSAKMDMHQYMSNVLAPALELALIGHLQLYGALAAAKERFSGSAPLERHWPDLYQRFATGLYRTIIEPHRSLRNRFMASVQQAAEAATNTSSEHGVTPLVLHSLHFLAHLVAAVALTDRDDVLRLLCHLNSLVSRRADAIQATVADSLGGEVEGGGAAVVDIAAQELAGLDANTVRQHRRACVGMCMVLLLKRFLVQAYHIKEEMLQTYNPALKRQEGVLDRRKDAQLRMQVDMESPEAPAKMPAQFAAFKQLLADDTDDYSAAHLAAGLAVPSAKGRKSRQPADGGAGKAGKGAVKKKGKPKKRKRDSDEPDDE
eukprot:jgi/Ulvmu1/1213/UM109_0011.1